MTIRVTVIGGGLAGSEAAWQIARQGVPVRLCEMRGVKSTPAHRGTDFAELVCSNSLRSNVMTNAVGLLKEEMRKFDSIILRAADASAVPAGSALAVDRERFQQAVTQQLTQHPLIEVVRGEVAAIPPDGPVVIATGPLTSESLAASIQEFVQSEYLYFYDAASPIITRESIDFDRVFVQDRYDKGSNSESAADGEGTAAAYINCPMTREEFDAFYEALVHAETAPLHDFEEERYFEGCMPVEVMAGRGAKTLLFGTMKPVGLTDPRTNRRPYAVVQLRQDNAAATLYNIVGFQTHLKWGEQSRVFRMIPGLENAEFVRFGVMHRNTYINSPTTLYPTYQTRRRSDLFFAGQITGVEGYVESAAAGLVAGLNAGRFVRGEDLIVFPPSTAMGSLAHYITHASADHFQPMNATFGLFPGLEEPVRDKKQRHERMAERALAELEKVLQTCRTNVSRR